MKKVGILCAGDTEFFPFLQYLKNETVTTLAMLQFHEGLIEGVPVVALYSGVCKVNAAIAAQLLIDIFHADIIINAGTAGAIDGSVRLFDTIIADKMAYHDVADDILTEFHPWMESVYFKPSAEFLRLRKTTATPRSTVSCSGQSLQENNLSTIPNGLPFLKNMPLSLLIWKRQALPMSAMSIRFPFFPSEP